MSQADLQRIIDLENRIYTGAGGESGYPVNYRTLQPFTFMGFLNDIHITGFIILIVNDGYFNFYTFMQFIKYLIRGLLGVFSVSGIIAMMYIDIYNGTYLPYYCWCGTLSIVL